MIVVLLLTAALVLGGLGFGVYLLVRPDPPAQGAPATAPTSAPSTVPTRTEPTRTEPTGTPPAPRPTEPEDPGPTTGETTGETAGSGAGDPRVVARDYVRAVNDRDETAATGLTCSRTDAGTLYPLAGDREVALRGVEVIEDTVASATVRLGDEETALLLENQENGWCVSI